MLWSRRLILLSGWYAQIKVRVDSVLDTFLHLIEPFCVNGVDVSWKKGKLFGNKL